MKNYSNLGLFKSKGRIFKESNSLYRTPFQRDRDRIIHSASFRRLKHKTQVFVIFEGKRKQRSIPIITPLKNQTVAFTRTIANMYFEKQEHKNIAEHKISYLLEFIRVKLHIPTTKIDAVFYENLALRSGNNLEEVVKLFKFCDAIHLKNQITNEELIKLNSLIEKFKKTIQYGK